MQFGNIFKGWKLKFDTIYCRIIIILIKFLIFMPLLASHLMEQCHMVVKQADEMYIGNN